MQRSSFHGIAPSINRSTNLSINLSIHPFIYLCVPIRESFSLSLARSTKTYLFHCMYIYIDIYKDMFVDRCFQSVGEGQLNRARRASYAYEAD